MRNNIQASLLAPKNKRTRASFLIYHFLLMFNAIFMRNLNVEIVETLKVQKAMQLCDVVVLSCSRNSDQFEDIYNNNFVVMFLLRNEKLFSD